MKRVYWLWRFCTTYVYSILGADRIWKSVLKFTQIISARQWFNTQEILNLLLCAHTILNKLRLFSSKISKMPRAIGLRDITCTLQWCHNERHGVSNHRRLYCLLNRLLRPRSKKASKLRVTGLCEGNSPVTGEFPTQRASNAENVFIWWRHHAQSKVCTQISMCLYMYILFVTILLHIFYCCTLDMVRHVVAYHYFCVYTCILLKRSPFLLNIPI